MISWVWLVWIVAVFIQVIISDPPQNPTRCPRLPRLWNGDVTETCLRIVGSQCNFYCKKPYILQGSENRTCLGNGTWSGETPSCEIEGSCSECERDVPSMQQQAAQCPSLNPPPGGFLRGTCNPGQVGLTCIFNCPAQTTLVGQPALVCLPSGGWSDSPPICRSGTTGGTGVCRTLTAPAGGRLVGSCANALTGDICQLVCISGFRPSDIRVLVCQQNGQWSNTLPTCIGATAQCPAIAVPQATLSGTCNPGVPGQTCTITCRNGFTIIGTTTLTCQPNGMWSGAIPTCNVASCPALQPSPNSDVSGTCARAAPGQTCTFTCHPGFRLVGQPTLVCLPGSTWSSAQPTCNANNCPALFPPLNGNLFGSCSQAVVGQSCSFSCNPGFVLTGQQTLFCGQNRQWSALAPTCRRTGCPPLAAPTGGRQDGSCTQAVAGQTCTFACQPGLQLVGQATLICQPGGTWSGNVPVCTTRQTTCPPLVAVANGYVMGTCSPGQVGQSCIFACNENFVLVGQRTFVCQANGIWNGNLPRCVRGGESEGCPALMPPINGEFVECDNRLGGRCVVNCLRGYVRSGSRVRTCLQQGTWSGFAPVCTRRPAIGSSPSSSLTASIMVGV